MRYKIEMAPLAGRHVVAFKNPETGKTVKVMAVNDTAATMIRGLADDIPDTELAERIASQSGAPREAVLKDLKALKEKLLSACLL